MPPRETLLSASGLSGRLLSFVAERFPFALGLVRDTLAAAMTSEPGRDPDAIEALRTRLAGTLAGGLGVQAASDLPDTTPGVEATIRLAQGRDELVAGMVHMRRERS